MFFLIRMAFWFSLVLLALPLSVGSDEPGRTASGRSRPCSRRVKRLATSPAFANASPTSAKPASRRCTPSPPAPRRPPRSRPPCWTTSPPRPRHLDDDRQRAAGDRPARDVNLPVNLPIRIKPSRRRTAGRLPSRRPRCPCFFRDAAPLHDYIRVMTTTIQTIRDDFSFLDEWEDRYRYVIELGEALPPFPDDERNAANKVPGCVSQVWLTTERDRAAIRSSASRAIRTPISCAGWWRSCWRCFPEGPPARSREPMRKRR